MTHPIPDAGEIAPFPHSQRSASPIGDLDVDAEKAKATNEHVENASIIDKSATRDVDAQYDGEDDDTKPRTGLRRLLRRDPGIEFMREVAEANAEELNPKEVRAVERKLYWLIVPPLFIDYAFYYVSWL